MSCWPGIHFLDTLSHIFFHLDKRFLCDKKIATLKHKNCRQVENGLETVEFIFRFLWLTPKHWILGFSNISAKCEGVPWGWQWELQVPAASVSVLPQTCGIFGVERIATCCIAREALSWFRCWVQLKLIQILVCWMKVKKYSHTLCYMTCPLKFNTPPKKRGHTTLDQVSTLLQESSKLVGGMRKKQLLLLLHFFLCSLLNPWGLFLAYWYHFTMTHLSFFSTSLLKACNHHHRRRECASGWDGLQVLMMMMEEGKAIFIKLGPKKGKGNMVERAL